MNKTYRYSLIPVILGGSGHAAFLSIRWFFRYHVRAYIFSETLSPSLWFPFPRHFRRLRKADSFNEFLLWDLCRFSEKNPDRVLALVPGNQRFGGIIRENSALLEQYFILSDDELSFLGQTTAK